MTENVGFGGCFFCFFVCVCLFCLFVLTNVLRANAVTNMGKQTTNDYARSMSEITKMILMSVCISLLRSQPVAVRASDLFIRICFP